RRLPFAANSRRDKGQPPLRPAPPPLLAVGLAAGDSPLWAPCSQPPCGRRAASGCRPSCPQAPPLRAATSMGCCPCGRLPPLAGWSWLQPAAPLRGLGRGLAVDGRPYMGVGRGWPPLLLATFTAKM
ncbi:hypothetical protein GW17_00009744, partial [Ensete ventricosum]